MVTVQIHPGYPGLKHLPERITVAATEDNRWLLFKTINTSMDLSKLAASLSQPVNEYYVVAVELMPVLFLSGGNRKHGT